MNSPATLPKRLHYPGHLQLLLTIGVFWLVIHSLSNAEISLSALLKGIPEMWSVLTEMFPPNIEHLANVMRLLLETFYMAVAGTFIGIVIAIPLGVFAARNTTPLAVLYHLTRILVSLARTVPDLVWALFFVVTVGFGSFAGVLTLAVDTVGFCGRFFAEAFEEVDKQPEDALLALGGRKIDVFITYIFPTSLPSVLNSCLFSLEKAVRSSVVLGLVGAGGIGVELKNSMDTFAYDKALTIIIAIFVLVLLVEKLSTRLRSSLL